jgi:Flp pilus assembly protein TadG
MPGAPALKAKLRPPASLPKTQRGVAIVLIVAGLAALILMSALALDVGHATLNKTRLQNATDAAALAAAKTLDQTGSTVLATQEALDAFKNNANSTGNRELATSYANGTGNIQIDVQYSTTLPPFTAGAPAGPYVRVIATGFSTSTWLAQIAGITQMTVGARAVAGPSPVVNNACNIAPMMVCGDPAAGAANLWGYAVNAPTVLKKSAPGGNSPVGPGNFQLIRLGGTGANVVRDNLAGGYSGCATTGDNIETQTGNEAGPTAQGLNTRFGDYRGPMHGTQDQYPPDVIVKAQTPELTVETVDTTNIIMQGTTQITAQNVDVLYNYQDYRADLPFPARYDYQPREDGGIGAFDRRVVAVPVGNCTGTVNGQGSVQLLGFACFFLLQPVVQRGNDAFVLGQFIGQCDVNGTPGPNPGTGPSPYVIQLYRDPNSGDS